MDLITGVANLTKNGERIQSLARGLSLEEARWRPAPGRWSVLEVLCHLLDEEKEDFRTRLDHILHEPDVEWPAIDPEGWVTERGYIERDLIETLVALGAERQRSVEWLVSLEEPDWEKSQTARGRTMRAGDMLAAWVTHDLLHMRQLVALHTARIVETLSPYDPSYAGPM